MKKKLLSLALVAAMALSVVACGGKEEAAETPAEEVVTAKVIDVELTEEQYAYGVDKNQPELLEEGKTEF